MRRTECNYREWVINLADDIVSEYGSYRDLFGYLYSRDFYSDVGHDINRGKDGKELRYRYLNEENLSGSCMEELDFPCNMLEMMVALAIRAENQIMWDPETGDRTGTWLYAMLVNLGIDQLTDGSFAEGPAEEAIDRLLAHGYSRNGEGGLFYVKKPRRDMRRTEIWYQMNWYLDEFMDS